MRVHKRKERIMEEHKREVGALARYPRLARVDTEYGIVGLGYAYCFS